MYSFVLLLCLVALALSHGNQGNRLCRNDYYNYDGYCNNKANPNLGKAGEFFRRGPEGAEFGDIPHGQTFLFSNRPNERSVSNAISAFEGGSQNSKGLNLLMTFFGQLLTHDMARAERPSDNRSDIAITNPNDPLLFLNGVPKTAPPFISTRRSIGEIVNGQFEVNNGVTHVLDGSVFYGNAESLVDAIRTFEDGKLILKDFTIDVSSLFGLPAGSRVYTEHNMLPTANETGLPLDIANTGASPNHVFAAGDMRASENLILTSLQTVFAREHNRVATHLRARKPHWSDEKIFQKARTYVVALYQHIAFDEFLPAAFGRRNVERVLGDYNGYKRHVDPSTDQTFSTAAFRFGHSTIPENLTVVDDCGDVDTSVGFNGDLIFGGQPGAPFDPATVLGFAGGIDNILRAGLWGYAEEVDHLVVNSMRSIVIPIMFATGIDIISANMRRGRLHGVPNYYTLRQEYYSLHPKQIYGRNGCTADETSASPDPIECFTAFISNATLAGVVRDVYGKINRVDAWMGLFLESTKPQGSVASVTATNIILEQFKRTRDGDRFFWKNLDDDILDDDVRREIRRTSLADVIQRNTGIGNVPDNAFFVATPHDTCS